MNLRDLYLRVKTLTQNYKYFRPNLWCHSMNEIRLKPSSYSSYSFSCSVFLSLPRIQPNGEVANADFSVTPFLGVRLLEVIINIFNRCELELEFFRGFFVSYLKSSLSAWVSGLVLLSKLRTREINHFLRLWKRGKFQAVMAEWLRRVIRNHLGSSRVGSNPAHSVPFDNLTDSLYNWDGMKSSEKG